MIAISNAANSVIAINAYDEYGIPASTNIGRFQYTGQKWIAGIGLYDYKARMYSATLGRFMQTDPIGYKDGINWYDYVDGDPVNHVDPDGQAKKFGWVVELLKNGERRVRALHDKEDAIRARRVGENVTTARRSQAGQVQRAASSDPKGVLRHPGHDLKDGSKGSPHFQENGKSGHTFYSGAAATLGALASVVAALDQLTDPLHVESISVCQTPGRCVDGRERTRDEFNEWKRREERKNEEYRKRLRENAAN